MTAYLLAGVVLAFIAFVIWLYYQAKRGGEVETELDQANEALDEVKDATTIRNRVTGLPDVERERLRRKWGKRDVPGA